jgi:hypothetical protein
MAIQFPAHDAKRLVEVARPEVVHAQFLLGPGRDGCVKVGPRFDFHCCHAQGNIVIVLIHDVTASSTVSATYHLDAGKSIRGVVGLSRGIWLVQPRGRKKHGKEVCKES